MPARFLVRRSAIHGNGVFARIPLAAARRVLEYRGRLITHAEANRLYG
ncbi:nuclear protein SET, partial [mine drainage metagenome]